MENIATILRKISIKADVFFSGKLCGIQSFEGDSNGHLHLLKSGKLTLVLDNNRKIIVDEPSVIFMPGPTTHRIISDNVDAPQLVCANVIIESIDKKLLLDAVPDTLVLPLSLHDDIGRTASWLFEEAFNQSVARLAMIDKLSEMFLLQVLRYVLDNQMVQGGVLAALTHPQLSKVIASIHGAPEQSWTVDSLADVAAMSRSKFATLFRETVGTTPNDYITDVRIALAKEMLKDNVPVSIVANKVGYEHASALARIFRKRLGLSPKEWLKNA